MKLLLLSIALKLLQSSLIDLMKNREVIKVNIKLVQTEKYLSPPIIIAHSVAFIIMVILSHLDTILAIYFMLNVHIFAMTFTLYR